MQARMKNPAMVLPEALKGIGSIMKATHKGGVSAELLELISLRVSQINGCSACVYSHVQSAKKAGETDERVGSVSAWREAPFYTDAERAAFQLAEAATRIADHHSTPVSGEVWDAAADHFNEEQLSAIILTIGVTNFFNRINVSIQEPAGQSWG